MISPGYARCLEDDNETAVTGRVLRRYLEQQNGGGWMTEQPASRDDWDTMVRYNEKILQQQNLTTKSTTTTDHHQRRVEKPSPQQSGMTMQRRTVSQRVERPNFKPPKPPKPTAYSSPQQTPKRLLPVQLYLNRQVQLLLRND